MHSKAGPPAAAAIPALLLKPVQCSALEHDHAVKLMACNRPALQQTLGRRWPDFALQPGPPLCPPCTFISSSYNKLSPRSKAPHLNMTTRAHQRAAKLKACNQPALQQTLTQVKGAALEHDHVLVVHAGALREDEERGGVCSTGGERRTTRLEVIKMLTQVPPGR